VFCKYDTSLKKDGPHSCRILKPKKSQPVNFFNFSKFISYNYKMNHIHGWSNEGAKVKFDMGTSFKTSEDLKSKYNDAHEK